MSDGDDVERELAPLDMSRVLKLCVLHDLGEAIHGNQPAIAQDADKNTQERLDLLTMLRTLVDGETRRRIDHGQ
nr:HD domain-containing protein [Kushneria pakistanensis]